MNTNNLAPSESSRAYEAMLAERAAAMAEPQLAVESDELTEAAEHTLTSSERSKINAALRKNKLDGTGRFETAGKALILTTEALDSVGFDLDMVSDHALPQAHQKKAGAGGNLMLTFRRKYVGSNSFSEGVQIKNSRISFTYENLDASASKPIEVVAYAS
jgi:hypothetical protein